MDFVWFCSGSRAVKLIVVAVVEAKCRCVDRRHCFGSVRATGYKQIPKDRRHLGPSNSFPLTAKPRGSEADCGGIGDRSSVVA